MVRPSNLDDAKISRFKRRITAWIESKRFTDFIAGLIILNAITLGLETNPDIHQTYGAYLSPLDFLILFIFVIELVLKLYAYGLSFFRVGWNVFDFVIVGGSLISAGGSMAILRTFRIFRVLRLMSIVPQMRRVITALFNAIPGMLSIAGVLFVIFYVAAVLTTQVFGSYDAPDMKHLFGSIGASMYTLFQIMTLEGWSENVVEPTMLYFPWAWAFFVPFIIITSFAVLNLFIGIIVDAMDIIHDLEDDEREIKKALQERADDLHADIETLRKDIADIKTLLKDRS